MTLMMMFHTALAVVGLVLGAVLLARMKGTMAHRLLGWIFAGVMIGVAVTGVLIAMELGRWSIFLVFSAITLVGVPGGLVAIWKVAHGARDRLESHYYFMAWSYAGLLLALVAQAFLSASKLGWLALDGAGGWAYLAAMIGGAVLANRIIERAKAPTLARYGVALGGATTKPA